MPPAIKFSPQELGLIQEILPLAQQNRQALELATISPEDVAALTKAFNNLSEFEKSPGLYAKAFATIGIALQQLAKTGPISDGKLMLAEGLLEYLKAYAGDKRLSEVLPPVFRGLGFYLDSLRPPGSQQERVLDPRMISVELDGPVVSPEVSEESPGEKAHRERWERHMRNEEARRKLFPDSYTYENPFDFAPVPRSVGKAYK